VAKEVAAAIVGGERGEERFQDGTMARFGFFPGLSRWQKRKMGVFFRIFIAAERELAWLLV
jgi:hypothetical protein